MARVIELPRYDKKEMIQRINIMRAQLESKHSFSEQVGRLSPHGGIWSSFTMVPNLSPNPQQESQLYFRQQFLCRTGAEDEFPEIVEDRSEEF